MEKSQNRKPFQALRDLFHPVDLTHGTCWRTILQFSLPVILSYLLQQVYSISDAAIVGQTLSAAEVAGVNDTNSLVFIFLQFAFGVSAGFCVITSYYVGMHDERGVRRSLATQLLLSAALTVVLTALALVLLDPMLAWINVTPAHHEVYTAAHTYCAIIFAGIGAQLFYNFICSFLRAMGDSVTPLLFLLFSTVLNVGLDLAFILVFRWGVAVCAGLLGGTAVADTIGNSFSSAKVHFWILAAGTLIFGAIGFFVAEMLIEKNFRVFHKKRVGEWAVLTVVLAAFLAPFLYHRTLLNSHTCEDRQDNSLQSDVD